LTTRETVFTLTPAASATSRIVGLRSTRAVLPTTRLTTLSNGSYAH
jgi:hypothetical protein